MLNDLHIVIDAGNTSIKLGMFLNNQLQKVEHLKESEIVLLCNDLADSPIIISSVGKDINHLLNLLINKKRLLILDHQTKVPIVNLYKSPNTLGSDRLAGCVGAKQIFKTNPCLVIDIGTCITYDFISANSEYLGGAISPGINIRFQALHNFTAKLPLVTLDETPDLIGNDTISSIKSGVVNGISAEINGIIDRYLVEYPTIKVIICGGHSNFFETSIKHPIFASPDLVLKGLHGILIYNELEINK